jgi:hypothetical protein
MLIDADVSPWLVQPGVSASMVKLDERRSITMSSISG